MTPLDDSGVLPPRTLHAHQTAAWIVLGVHVALCQPAVAPGGVA